MGELNVVNSNSVEETLSVSGLGSKSSSPSDPALMGEESFSAAEEAAEQVLNWVHPTLDSEEKRRDVTDYVQRIVKSRLNCEAFSYGSVPLKTYLPDGDIDLTILKGPNAEESLGSEVLSVLEDEEQNQNAEYQVKDTQFIDAEVKLVKCFVRNIVVDITFNQVGGLSTLCFLEKVDFHVGRNHLFKRSIILVKTWCYYESRILGAHHGLISTYALEILVLYIFHFFHSLLSGPLAVLYKFLDYYSKFDWENYCISLKGPVHKSSLPDIVVKMPENGGNNLLLGEEFLENCMELFSIPFRGPEATPKAFQPKHINIIDPLKENNNLGRSVHRGNFYRIRSAFKYGAHKLGQVLIHPRDEVADAILNFFSDTRARHEHQHATNTRHLFQEFSDQESLAASLSSPIELFSDDEMFVKSPASGFDNDSVGMELSCILDSEGELDRYSISEVSPKMSSEAYDSSDGTLVSGHSIVGGKYGLATSASSDNNIHKLLDFTSKSSTENGSSEDQQIDLTGSDKSAFNLWWKNSEEHVEMNNAFRPRMDNPKVFYNYTTDSNSTPKAHILETLCLDFRDIGSANVEVDSEALNALADLTGDSDNNIRSLLSAQLCHGFSISASPRVFNPPSPLSGIRNKKPRDIASRSISPKENGFLQMDANLMFKNHIISTDSDSTLLGTAFFEGAQKSRGTGTYLPHVSAAYMERHSHWREWNISLGNHNCLQTYHSNGFYPTGESNSSENGSHEALPTQKIYPGRRKRSNVQCQSPRAVGDRNQINGCLDSLFRIEFGSVGNLAEEMISGSADAKCSTTGASLNAQCSTLVMMQDGFEGRSFHLKNEDEFPPLCL